MSFFWGHKGYSKKSSWSKKCYDKKKSWWDRDDDSGKDKWWTKKKCWDDDRTKHDKCWKVDKSDKYCWKKKVCPPKEPPQPEEDVIQANDDVFVIGETESISANLVTGAYPGAQGGDDNVQADDLNGGTDGITVTEVSAAGATVAPGAGVGNSFTVTLASGRSGTVTINADGSLSFDPGSDFEDLRTGESETIELTYTISSPGTPGDDDPKDCDWGHKSWGCSWTSKGHDGWGWGHKDWSWGSGKHDKKWSSWGHKDKHDKGCSWKNKGWDWKCKDRDDDPVDPVTSTATVTIVIEGEGVPSTVVAENDTYFLAYDDLIQDGGNLIFEFGAADSILLNDSDPDMDNFAVSAVGGISTPAGGPFGPADGSDFGKIIVNTDGTFRFQLTPDDISDVFQQGDFADPLTTTFQYQIMDDSSDMAVDTAEISITIEPFMFPPDE